jgi:DNA invertase Pin-like site-specific DNA recombinase
VTPPRPRFVSYLRVSTDGQGRSGLGLEAQRQAVGAHVTQAGGEVVAEFQEVESGKRADRPQLAAALASCRTRRAVLVIAKVPAGPVGKFLVTQMAAVAELEAGLISQRTRAALAVAKARGVRLGNPFPTPATAEMAAAARQARSRQVAARASDVLAVVRQVQTGGASSLRAIAAELHAHGVLTPAGKLEWSPVQVQRLLKRDG